jgi:DNA-binding CsgD family transcriptional regulator
VYHGALVRHLVILIDFLCLAAGLACLATIVSQYRAERTERNRARLAFFGAYSSMMVTAALFAYAAVNIGVASEGQTLLASLIFVGMAAIELSLPRMIYADRGAPLPLLAKRLVLGGAALTAAQAALIWLPFGPSAQLLCFMGAFSPFGAIVVWTTIAGARLALPGRAGPASTRALLFGAVYALILVGSVFEIRSALAKPEPGAYLPLSLPLAYLASSLQFFASSSRRSSSARLSLPPGLAEERRLSPRETEIADCILEGLGNKEIAARLGISENTARNHIYSLYQKLGIQKRMDLLGLVRSGGNSRKIPPSPEAS